MSPNVTSPGMPQAASGPLMPALVAAVMLVFAAAIAPICGLMVVCSMPCCEGKSVPFVQSTAAAACTEHCGISSNTASHQLPDAVAASSETPQISFAGLSVAEAADSMASAESPRLPARSVEVHHATPGDAPLYVYNSVFLI
jgi:hypothetical protein